MAKSPEELAATMVANLKEKTGRSLDDWLKVVKRTKLAKHGEILKHLKSEHGVTHGFANLIAGKALATATPAKGADDLVEAQYSGAKAGLRDVYDKIVKAVEKFGQDVEISPKKTYVSFRRNKQFAIVQASTKTRVDVGLNLKGTEPEDRLEASGSFNSMVSHRVRIAAAKEVDKQLIAWLKQAYQQS